jgi:outer membrane protein TolC
MRRSLLSCLALVAAVSWCAQAALAQSAPAGDPAGSQASAASEEAAESEAEAIVDTQARDEGLIGADGPTATGSGEGARQDALVVPDSEVTNPTDLQPGAQIVTDGRPLSIAEAVALSIRNNLNVEVERFEPLIQESNKEGAWGAYDPTISGDAGYEVIKTPNTFLAALNPIETNRESIAGGGVGVDQLIPYLGASVGFRFDSAEVTTRSAIQTLDPRYDSSLFFTAKVPLARNLIWNEAWTNVKLRDVAYRRSQETFRTALMDNVRSTVDRYWNLVAARDQVRVAQKSLETARALLEQTETQFEVGVVSRVDVVEAEAGVADREFQVIRTANAYRNAQDALIDTVLGRELSALTDLQFVPTEDPEPSQLRRVDVQESVRTAFHQRPELEVEDRLIEQGELDLKFAKNQRLPQVDFDARFGYIGASGDSAVPTPFFESDYENSTDDWFTGDGRENYEFRGTFSIPFPNTTARKRVVRSRLELRRAKTRRIRLEQSIVVEVRAAARLLLASAQGIEAAERRRLAAEEQLRAERIRLEHGESTPFEVLQRESDLVEAESQKIDALQAYRSAEIGLERSQGTILEFHDVVLEDSSEPQEE